MWLWGRCRGSDEEGEVLKPLNRSEKELDMENFESINSRLGQSQPEEACVHG